MSSLKELVYQQGWAKVELESILLIDESLKSCSKFDLLPIFYIKIGNGCILKTILDNDLCNCGQSFLISDYDLEFDSFLIDEGRPVLDDGLDYADSFSSSPAIPIPEPGKPHYRKAIICNNEEILPSKIVFFIKKEVYSEFNVA